MIELFKIVYGIILIAGSVLCLAMIATIPFGIFLYYAERKKLGNRARRGESK